jgi:hypothetical protein
MHKLRLVTNTNSSEYWKNFFFTVRRVIFLSIFLQGCSNVEGDLDNENSISSTNAQEKINDEQLNKEKADIERILGLEGDMQLLIEQLSLLSEIDNNPLENSRGSEPTSKSTKGLLEKNNKKKQKTTGVGKSTSSIPIDKKEKTRCGSSLSSKSTTEGHCFPKIGIHIASIENSENSSAVWEYFLQKLPIPLQAKKPLIKEYLINNNVLYSLRIGPFQTPNIANNYCMQLKEQSYHCVLVEYDGSSFF